MTIEARPITEIEGLDGRQIKSDYQKEVEETATTFLRSAVLRIPEVASAIDEARKIGKISTDYSPSKYTVARFYEADDPEKLISALRRTMGTRRLDPSIVERWEENFDSIINCGMGEEYPDILASAEPSLLPVFLDSSSMAKASLAKIHNETYVAIPQNSSLDFLPTK